MTGEVLAVGPGYWIDKADHEPTRYTTEIGRRMPICCKPGDKVMYKPLNSFLVSMIDEQFLVPDQDICAIL